MQLRGAVAVVTGASAGIGRATAWSLAREGAKVVLSARREERLEELAGRIRKRGGEALVMAGDVTRKRDLRALFGTTVAAFGHIDVLVNNAGLPGGGRFADVPLDRLERVMETNYVALVRATKLVLPAMIERGRGHVVNIASLAGRYAIPGSAVYSSTKHAVVAFSEALYMELYGTGVLVTAVNPGLVRTEGFPQTGYSDRFVMAPERVAEAIVRVIRDGRAPEVSVPRWLAIPQVLRTIAPGPFRWALRKVTTRGWRAPESGG